jgi:Tfp pilus tip-associated adhesin PilY1
MGGDGVNSRSSQPLMLLDGLLTARDIAFADSRPAATYMAGTLGLAGNGFYMVDVTNPNNKDPKFVWAIENSRYENPAEGSVHRWGKAVNRYDALYEGYKDLGLTIIASELKGVREKLNDGSNDDFRYVGVIPGGLGHNLDDPKDSQGRAFFIFKPGDGSIIKKITTANGYAGPTGSTLGMGITPVHYLYDDGKTKLHATEFFTGDSEGNVLHCDLTYPVEDWKLKSIFRLRTEKDDKPIALSGGYLILKDRAKTSQWLFAGTSDVTAPGQTMISTPSGNVNQQRGIHNEEQYIFGLHMKNPKAAVKTDLSYPAGNTSYPVTMNDLTPLKYLKTVPPITPPWSEEAPEGEEQPAVKPDGWKLRLRPKIDDNVQPTEAEYATSEPFFQDGVLYIATFIPLTEMPTSQERCRDIGYSKLYALDPDTGESMWQGGQSYVFKNIKIVGISSARGNLFLGVKALRGGALEAFRQYEETKGFAAHAEGSIVEVGRAAKSKSSALPNISPEIPHLQYWREIF